MKIMTLNVWQGRLERLLLKHISTMDLDFVCMQEAVDYEDSFSVLFTDYHKIGQNLQARDSFFSNLNSIKFGIKDLNFGNVIYSKIPFEQTSTIFTRGEYRQDFSFDTDDYNIRAFQHTIVDLNGKILNILNHHGHHIEEHKLGDEETMRQTRQILSYISSLSGAVIVCGDFNLSPESDSIKMLSTELKNQSTLHNLKTTRSKLTHKNEVCDYIFTNEDVTVKSFCMDETIISDHNALILEFDLK